MLASVNSVHVAEGGMDGLEIVDAHMHLWTPTTHPWVEKVRGGGHPAGNFGEHKLCVMDSG